MAYYLYERSIARNMLHPQEEITINNLTSNKARFITHRRQYFSKLQRVRIYFTSVAVQASPIHFSLLSDFALKNCSKAESQTETKIDTAFPDRLYKVLHSVRRRCNIFIDARFPSHFSPVLDRSRKMISYRETKTRCERIEFWLGKHIVVLCRLSPSSLGNLSLEYL